MGQKKITDLTLRSALIAACNFVIDDTIQTYRITATQIYEFLWPLWSSSRTISAAGTALTSADRIVYLNPTSSSFVQDLPACADLPLDFKITLKNIATNGNTATLDGSGSELIDNATTLVLGSDPTMDAVTLINTLTKWLVI